MYCNYCRATNADDSSFCRSCGKPIVPISAAPANVAEQAADSSGAPLAEIRLSKPQPSGVGGWLALLVFGLVIGGPISLAAGAASARDAVTVFFLVGLAVWSIYCGIALIRKKPNAPRITKIYFIVLFCLYAVAIVGGIVQSANSASVDVADDAGRVIGAFLATIAWYAYLEKSKRVKHTYQPPSVV